MTAPRVRTLIVEDERRARESLREAFSATPWIDLVGEACDGDEAVRLLQEIKPDLALLDVQLPKRSGIDVLRALAKPPHVIFTTAYDAFAVTAFELGAIDYLQKPFSRARLVRALERVKPLLAVPPLWPTERLQTLASDARLRRLFVRDGAHISGVSVDDIQCVDAEGDYARIHTRERQYFVRATMRELVDRLDPNCFVRAHRSHLINTVHVKKLSPAPGGRLTVWLTGGRSLTTSREGARLLRALVIS